MSMEMAPAVDPPSGRVPEQLQIGPRTRVFGDGASGSSFWKIMAALSVLGQKGFYRRWRGLRGCPRSRCGSHPWVQVGPQGRVVPALWVAPLAALWSSGIFHRIKNLHKFLGQSDDISSCDFSEIQKQQKQGTGTGHLVNSLV